MRRIITCISNCKLRKDHLVLYYCIEEKDDFRELQPKTGNKKISYVLNIMKRFSFSFLHVLLK